MPEVFEISNFLHAFVMTLLAGLATGIGGLIVLKMDRTNTRILSAALGFSAGVMVYVSFMELMNQGLEYLLATNGEKKANWMLILAFFGGIALIALIDYFVPEEENPHEFLDPEDIDGAQNPQKAKEIGEKRQEQEELKRTGLMSTIAIAIHNFPEGIATFISALVDPKLGLSIAIAIAIHNIPEGIGVAVPIFYATGDKRKGFWYALLSGLAEPLGALVGALILYPFLSENIMGIVFAVVAGIMVYISFDELLPTAEKYGEHHIAIYGVIAGMAIMAITLVIV